VEKNIVFNMKTVKKVTDILTHVRFLYDDIIEKKDKEFREIIEGLKKDNEKKDKESREIIEGLKKDNEGLKKDNKGLKKNNEVLKKDNEKKYKESREIIEGLKKEVGKNKYQLVIKNMLLLTINNVQLAPNKAKKEYNKVDKGAISFTQFLQKNCTKK
jgi:hypothetical protein